MSPSQASSNLINPQRVLEVTMPRSQSKLPNIEDLIILAMAIIGLIIVIHAILMSNATPPSQPPSIIVIPRLMPVSLIAP